MVKLKTGILKIFGGRARRLVIWLAPILSLLTFISSWLAIYSPELVERWFARGLFPRFSAIAGRFADSISISWLDIGVPATVVLLALFARKRQWFLILNLAAAGYLIFFWSWGLNYHRKPLAVKLHLDTSQTEPSAMESFARRTAGEVNRAYRESHGVPYDEERTKQEAFRRVQRVVEVIDGSKWRAAGRIKISWIANPWFHAAGIDGFFNPLVHEPIVSDSVLDIERPFVISHELAHVRGYPDEGDANLIATFATVMSEDPRFRYSGWLNLWLYLRTRELERLLDPGPVRDIDRMAERARREQIPWVNDFQRSLLDLFLKANNVEQGVRSYSRVVLLAAGTESTWDLYR